MNFHPHVHAIASHGGWRKDGTWVPVAYVDSGAAEKVFRHHVLSFLRKRGLIDEERVQLLLSWRHSGFSVHNSVVVEPEDPTAVERLIRYVMRAPVALERLHYDDAAGVMEIRSRPGGNDEPDGQPRERVDADELVARVIAQVPDPRRHLIHAYGWYANAAREAEAGCIQRSSSRRLGVVRAGDRRQRRSFRPSGAPRRTPALGRPDPPDLRSGSTRLLELRRPDEDRRVYHRPQGDPRDSGLGAQERRSSKRGPRRWGSLAQRWRYTSGRSSSELASPLGCTRPEIGAIQIVAWRQRDEECGPARSGGVCEGESNRRRK